MADRSKGWVYVMPKIPSALREEIDRLAKKQGDTRNGWILKRLEQAVQSGVGLR